MLKIYDYGNVHKSDTYSRLYFQDSELDVVKKIVENYWDNFYKSDEGKAWMGDWHEFSWKIVKTKKGIKYRLYETPKFNDRRRSWLETPRCQETILVLPNA